MNNIKYRVFSANDKSDEKELFFTWALKNKLFRNIYDEPDLKNSYQSRLEKIYKKERLIKDFTAVLAFNNNEPIGIVFCENAFYKRKTDYIPMNKKKATKVFDAEAVGLGFVSFYVKNEYRQQGVASKMFNVLELEKLKLIIANKEKNKSLMCFEAREKGVDMVKKSQYSYPVHSSYQSHFDYLGKLLFDDFFKDKIFSTDIEYKREPIITEIKSVKTIKINTLLKKGLILEENNKNKKRM